jgi:hypothetical protein
MDTSPESQSSVPNTAAPPHATSSKKTWMYALVGLVVIICIAGAMYAYKMRSPSTNNQPQSTATTENKKSITFNAKEYTIGFTDPAQQPGATSESYEWVTGGETVDTWTTLITTHKLSPTDVKKPLAAETYAQNVAALQQKNGALILETSLVNQDSEKLGIDPKNPPYLLVYMFASGGMTEFDMQRIQQLPNGSIGSMIYAERFTTKSQADMKAYYDSPERLAKRIELIKTTFPY